MRLYSMSRPRAAFGLARGLPALALLLLLPSAAQADPCSAAGCGDPVLPPLDLDGSRDPYTGHIALRWLAPTDAGYVFHVYRNGQEIGATALASFTDTQPLPSGSAPVYTVTAQSSTSSSAPSNPFTPFLSPFAWVVENMAEDTTGNDFHFRRNTWCDPVHVGIPHPGIDEHCVWRLLQYP